MLTHGTLAASYWYADASDFLNGADGLGVGCLPKPPLLRHGDRTLGKRLLPVFSGVKTRIAQPDGARGVQLGAGECEGPAELQRADSRSAHWLRRRRQRAKAPAPANL